MPRKDLNSLQGLLADLWHETTWIVRLCLFGGLAGGLLTFFLILSRLEAAAEPGDHSLGHATRLLVFLGLAAAVLGGLLGLAVGVVVELIVARLRPPKKPRRRRQR